MQSVMCFGRQKMNRDSFFQCSFKIVFIVLLIKQSFVLLILHFDKLHDKFICSDSTKHKTKNMPEHVINKCPHSCISHPIPMASIAYAKQNISLNWIETENCRQWTQVSEWVSWGPFSFIFYLGKRTNGWMNERMYWKWQSLYCFKLNTCLCVRARIRQCQMWHEMSDHRSVSMPILWAYARVYAGTHTNTRNINYRFLHVSPFTKNGAVLLTSENNKTNETKWNNSK